MFRTPIALLCICLVATVQAKLGETVPELTKRFGKEYTVEAAENGQQYKFRSATVSVDVFVKNGVSVSEMYYSDHALNSKGEPPNEIVQSILRTNVPHARWVDTKAKDYQADYALRSSDGRMFEKFGIKPPDDL